MNSTTIVGNLAADPEVRFTASGQAVVTFGLAVNRRWLNRQTQEWDESVSFFDVVAWRELAENVGLSFKKGDRVLVTGRIEQRSWTTDDGSKRYKVEVVAEEIGASVRWATVEMTKNAKRDGDPGPGAEEVPF